MFYSDVACKKCYYVLINPKKCGTCKKHSCEYCVSSCCHGYHSTAEKPYNEEPDNEVKQELKNLRFRCCYYGRGCGYNLAIDELISHEYHCVHAYTCGYCNSINLDLLKPFAQEDPHLGMCDQIKSEKSQSWFLKAKKILKEPRNLKEFDNSEMLSSICDSESTEAEYGNPTLHEAQGQEHKPADLGHTSSVHTLFTLKDGFTVSCSEELIQICDTATGKCIRTFKSERRVLALKYLGNGYLASASDDLSVRIWPIHTENYPKSEKVLYKGTKKVDLNASILLVMLPDGKLVSGGGNQPVRIWNPETGDCEKKLYVSKYRVTALAALNNGNLALGSVDNLGLGKVEYSVRIWNNASKSRNYAVLEGSGHKGPVRVLLELANGNLISGSEDSTIKVWQTDSGLSRTLIGHKATVSALAELPNGDIVSGSHDKSVRIWKKDSETCIFDSKIDSFVSSINYDTSYDSIILGLANGQIQKLKKHYISNHYYQVEPKN